MAKLQTALAGAMAAAEEGQVDADKEARRAAGMCKGEPLHYCERIAAVYGVDPPTGAQHGPIYRRFICKKWWKRKLERRNAQRLEHNQREAGEVCKMRAPYVSDETLEAIKTKRTTASEMLNKLIALNRETGEVINLGEAAAHGLANPAVRRAELLTRCRGMEEHAKSRDGWRAEMWTLTTPSRFHAANEAGTPNKKHQGETPRDARDYLQQVWSRVRAALAYREIEYYALRIAEPHHDGTPHWHILLFIERKNATAAYKIFADRGLAESPTERGAKKYRVDREVIRDGESATGYVLKYIVKNVDGVGMNEPTSEGVEAEEGASRASAWASVWGIRQFQFSGLMAIGPWRELRRVADAEKVPAGLLDMHTAARAGQFGDYLDCPRVWAMSLLKGPPNEGRYGDLIPTIRGVALGFAVLITRSDEWEIMPAWAAGNPLKPPNQKPTRNPDSVVEVRRDSARARGPWTRLNNCREYPENAQSKSTEQASGPP